MAIYVITGKPRHGKTYYLATMIPSWLKQAKLDGFKLFSNLKINYEKLGYGSEIIGNIYEKADRENPEKLLFYWRNIDTWNFMEKGTILVDEASRYFNARKWAMLSEETEIKLQQHGKQDLDIWATTQHYSRIDISMRILVERFVDIQMIFGSPDNEKRILPRVIQASEYYLEDMERMERMGKDWAEEKGIEPLWTEKKLVRKKYFRLYDTRQPVGSSLPMPLKHVERVCPDCGERKIIHV